MELYSLDRAQSLSFRGPLDFNNGRMNFEFLVLYYNIPRMHVLRNEQHLTMLCLGMITFQRVLRNKAIPASRPTPFGQYKNKQTERYKPPLEVYKKKFKLSCQHCHKFSFNSASVPLWNSIGL